MKSRLFLSLKTVCWLILWSLPVACTESAPPSKFSDNHDGTVTDKTNALMWQRCAVGQKWKDSWCSSDTGRFETAKKALESVSSSGTVNFAGHSDWRVPDSIELRSLVDEEKETYSTVDKAAFPNTPSAVFVTVDGQKEHFIAFHNDKSPSPTYAVRLVRDTKPKKYAVLLLHGMNSDYKKWGKLVNNSLGFNKKCTTIYDVKKTPEFNNIEQNVYCFQMNFGAKDRAKNAPTGLDGKMCWEHGGCKGDYSTFETLGEEVGDAVKHIKGILGDKTKIILLGHSRGGLAARAFLQSDHSDKSGVVGLITTGTPHGGSPLGRYYFYLNDNCLPESEHNGKLDRCFRDWEFVHSLLIERFGRGLDLKAPTNGFLAEASTDFIKDNPVAITKLNNNVSKLPDIKYQNIYYEGIKLGCSGFIDVYPHKFCGFDILSPLEPKVGFKASKKGRNAILNNRTIEALDGDGTVPVESQKMSVLPGFPFPNNVRAGRESQYRKWVHTTETKDITRLSNELDKMYTSLNWR